MGNHTTFGLLWMWNNLQPSVPIAWTWKLCLWEIPVLTWNLGLLSKAASIPTCMVCFLIPELCEMWGVGWVGHLMPSNEREVEDTLKYFKPNNYFHLLHLQSNIKSLNFTEYSKLVSIWISRLVKKKSNKKYITGTVGKVLKQDYILNNSILSMLSFLSVIILVCYVEENLCSKETPANC